MWWVIVFTAGCLSVCAFIIIIFFQFSDPKSLIFRNKKKNRNTETRITETLQMTYSAFIGQLFVSISPVLALFVMGVLPNSRMLIISIGGAFSWMFSALLSSALWYAIGPLEDDPWFTILLSVIIQEAVRVGFYFLLKWFQNKTIQLTKANEFPNPVLMGFAVGVGTGLAYVLVLTFPVLWPSKGPGAVFSQSCPSISLFTLTAVQGMLMSLLNVAWSTTTFIGFEVKNYFFVVATVVSHFAASYFVKKKKHTCMQTQIYD